MTVYRINDLPRVPATARIVVAEVVLERTSILLQQAHSEEEPHEGLVWWLGREVDGDFLIAACHRPPCRSGPDFVFTDEAALGAASRMARARRLSVLAQVHSHPGKDTRHSDGDDHLIVMPFEGMFSLVVGRYGLGGIEPTRGAGLHQFQDGRWVEVIDTEQAFIKVPTEVVE
jgi:proteasome lid subunit RPN8/RPN11